MLQTSVLRGTVFQLALGFVCLVSLAFLGVGAAAYWLVTEELQDRLDRRIVLEHASLMEILASEGRAALVGEVRRRARLSDNGDRIYLLSSGESGLLAGNIEPTGCRIGWSLVEDEDVSFLRPQSDDPDIYYVYGTQQDDVCLLTGRSNEDVEEAQEIVLESLGWGLLAVVAIGLACALGFGAHAQSRIEVVEHVLSSVARGDLTQRLPVTGSGDISRISRSINQALVRLERAVGSLKQVSVDIAHELKTPVSRLRHRLEAAQLNARSEQDYVAAMDAAIGETNAIVATFEALLRIAAIEAGARWARFSPVKLRDCLEAVAEIYVPVAADAGHTLTADLSRGESAVVQGDHELLMQMFVNIVENSIRHCPEGAAISIALTEDNGEASVVFNDDGPGIPRAEQEKVFDRMYRLDKSRSTRGNGLGLSLVAAIAELHDARIALENRSPGLTVKVTFAAQGGADSGARSGPAIADRDGSTAARATGKRGITEK